MDPHHNLEPFELSTIVEERTETASPTTSKISFRKDESFQSKDNNSKHKKPSSATLHSNSRSNIVVQKNQSQRSAKSSNGIVNNSASLIEQEDQEKQRSSEQNDQKSDDHEQSSEDHSEDNSDNSNSKSEDDDNGTILTKNKKDMSNCNISMGQIEAGSRSPRSIPNDSIILKLMIVTGDSAEFIFSLKTPASTISEHIWNNWPKNWPDSQKTTKAETLRLIYQGRFLHGNVTLGALKLIAKATTVMHLVHREKLPQAPPDDDDKKNGNIGNSGSGNSNGENLRNQNGESGCFVRFFRRICCCGQ